MPRSNDNQVGGNHYKGQPVEHWDFVKMHSIPYMEAQIIKYVMRHREKNQLEDLHKAQHFLAKLMEQEYTELDDTAGYPDGHPGRGYVDQD